MLANLRSRLTALARATRISTIPKDAKVTEPQSERNDTVYFEGRMVSRKRIVLLTPRCSSATCTMCPLPNEGLDPKYRGITAENIIAQIENSFASPGSNDCEVITLYNNGNFFSDNEIPPIARRRIYGRIRASNASVLIVESLPQFITNEKIAEAKRFLGDKRLIVAIGLQSSNDLVRELAINTTCTRLSFERAVALLRNNGFGTQAFLMIKPPFVTEREAIIDTVQSIRYLASLGIYDPILCTTRVAPNTVLELMHKAGHFNSPWIWTVVEVIKESAGVNLESKPRVVISELELESNPDSLCSSNCDRCSPRLIEAISEYNENRDLTTVSNIECACRKNYETSVSEEDRIYGHLSIIERVENFLNLPNVK